MGYCNQTISHTISHLYHHRSCLHYPMQFHMLPLACPGWFKCCPWALDSSKAAQILFRCSGSNQMLLLLVPYVCLSSLASKSDCIGLLIHIRHRCHCFLIPPPFPHLGSSSASLRQENDCQTLVLLHTTPQAYAGDTLCTPRRTQASGT